MAATALDRIWSESDPELLQKILDAGEDLNIGIERLLLPKLPRAPEFPESAISRHFPSLGGYGATYVDKDLGFEHMAANGFRDWSLEINGLVNRPARFTLDEIFRMPAISTITLHACEEGWSAIGKWTGVPLSWLMLKVGVQARARFAIFHAMDRIAGKFMFGSLDIARCLHPQTLLAYRINDQLLPVGHGAPLRLRSALDIGYKQVKHLSRISFVSSLEEVDGGRGGLFEIYGYQNYGGF
ncbi:hypothetical protein ATE69_13600 [Sphingopyxis sp. H071]|nr:hypothetical protein ATE61_14300 [Sphingopyxis sp. H057]KTE50382.1 hypothetical protein ATE64_16220 [Sphingopyxis sp. H073]KTE52471.1 hypothetical protein ATE69_13600 [Sphingopyxis sp. H071]KTE62964.1 hypothetical protein ATE66_01120 [Sphingopyxis sp. H107]KTE64854.1 hypothetical protein ATE65_10365 [Sphingopyxis sp. H100]KTE72196.1 hypothetical protein ATE60_10350 [Sphingopyxis sp. H081]KTE79727.1 hypothetical protein ATE63_13770 [Sphingopyxis sp. H067]